MGTQGSRFPPYRGMASCFSFFAHRIKQQLRDRECMSLKGNIEERACALACYIIEHRTTVRAAAKVFGVSKSTVHIEQIKTNGLFGWSNRENQTGKERNEHFFMVYKIRV